MRARRCSTPPGVLLELGRTGSVALAGATVAAAAVPGAASGPVLGAWLEVATHRRVLIVIDQLLSVAGLLAIVALAGHAPNWTVPAIAIVYSITRPFSSGSFYSALAEIARPDLLEVASAIEALGLNLHFVIGPALEGALAGARSAATAIEVSAAITALVAGLVAINPAFGARPEQRAKNVAHALRDGVRAIARSPVLRATGAASTLAAFGWGLTIIGFPLYASHTLHARTHAGGCLWAALASGRSSGPSSCAAVLRADASACPTAR